MGRGKDDYGQDQRREPARQNGTLERAPPELGTRADGSGGKLRVIPAMAMPPSSLLERYRHHRRDALVGHGLVERAEVLREYRIEPPENLL